MLLLKIPFQIISWMLPLISSIQKECLEWLGLLSLTYANVELIEMSQLIYT